MKSTWLNFINKHNVDNFYGYDDMLTYLEYQKTRILNQEPIVNESHLTHDMYYKGSWMLHTLRTIVDDDELWLSLIRGIYDQYKYQTVDAIEIIKYIEDFLDKDLTYFFDQYLHSQQIPEL